MLQRKATRIELTVEDREEYRVGRFIRCSQDARFHAASKMLPACFSSFLLGSFCILSAPDLSYATLGMMLLFFAVSVFYLFCLLFFLPQYVSRVALSVLMY